MSNPRLASFWTDLLKLQASYKEDGFIFGFFVIDKCNKVAEIQGDQPLKRILFESASTIATKWSEESENAPKPEKDLEDGKREKPPGTKCFLPMLPAGKFCYSKECIIWKPF